MNLQKNSNYVEKANKLQPVKSAIRMKYHDGQDQLMRSCRRMLPHDLIIVSREQPQQDQRKLPKLQPYPTRTVKQVHVSGETPANRVTDKCES